MNNLLYKFWTRLQRPRRFALMDILDGAVDRFRMIAKYSVAGREVIQGRHRYEINGNYNLVFEKISFADRGF